MNTQTQKNETIQKHIETPCAMDLVPELDFPDICKTSDNNLFAVKPQINEKGEVYFNGYRDYIQEYVELVKEWDSKGIDADNASYAQAVKMRKVKNNALKFSGLDHNELCLIAHCRKYSSYDLFQYVNIYFMRAMREIDSMKSNKY